MSDVKASFPASVTVDGFVVHKLKLSEYALVFDKLQKLPGLLAQFTTASEAQLLASLPRLAAVALPEVLEILAVATHKTVEELDDSMEAATAIRCLAAVFKVNDFFALWEEVQKVIGTAGGLKPKQIKKT